MVQLSSKIIHLSPSMPVTDFHLSQHEVDRHGLMGDQKVGNSHYESHNLGFSFKAADRLYLSGPD